MKVKRAIELSIEGGWAPRGVHSERFTTLCDDVGADAYQVHFFKNNEAVHKTAVLLKFVVLVPPAEDGGESDNEQSV